MKSIVSTCVSALVISTLAAVAGCSAAPSTDDALLATGADALTATQCAAKIKQKVLDRALEINETASIDTFNNTYGGVKVLYGNDRTDKVVLVRVTDEVEPTDYIVVQTGTTPAACTLKNLFVAAEGRVASDDALTQGKLGAACKAKMEKAVLKKALKINDTASVTGTKLIYGGDSLFGGVAIVRVSDETEPSDYVAGFTMNGDADQKAGNCTVKFTRVVADGLLPNIAGL